LFLEILVLQLTLVTNLLFFWLMTYSFSGLICQRFG